MTKRRVSRSLGFMALLSCFGAAHVAEAEGSVPLVVPVDRAVVRFSAPEIGGVRSPRFVFERELAFEARLEALTDSELAKHSTLPFLERHIQAAIERNIAETLLSSLHVEPEPSDQEITVQAEQAKRILLDRIGGLEVLERTARTEGMSEGDVITVFRRRARASLYLDRMVAPMLDPSIAELRLSYANDSHPYRAVSFEKAAPFLRRWLIGRKLRDAYELFYQNARQRLEVIVLTP